MKFDGSQILIGKGAQADVVRYQGYALSQDPLSFPILASAFAKVHEADPEGIDIPPLLLTAGMGLTEEDFSDAVRACFITRQKEKE